MRAEVAHLSMQILNPTIITPERKEGRLRPNMTGKSLFNKPNQPTQRINRAEEVTPPNAIPRMHVTCTQPNLQLPQTHYQFLDATKTLQQPDGKRHGGHPIPNCNIQNFYFGLFTSFL